MGLKLVFYTNRSTPQVLSEGQRPKPKKGYGSVTKVRKATPEEEAQARKGKWLRVDAKGNKPSSGDYKVTSYRPKLGAKRRAAMEKK